MPNFASGPYVWSYGPRDHADGTNLLGVVRDAPIFRLAREAEPITGDNLGAAIQGVVERGGNLYIDLDAQEVVEAAVRRAFWSYDPTDYANPFAATADILPVQLGRVGWSDSASGDAYRSIGRLVPTQELRGLKLLNPGDATTPEWMTVIRFMYVQPTPGFNIVQQFGSRLRNVGLSFLCQLYTQVNGTFTNTVWWDQDARP